jgi:hypothetical protein
MWSRRTQRSRSHQKVRRRCTTASLHRRPAVCRSAHGSRLLASLMMHLYPASIFVTRGRPATHPAMHPSTREPSPPQPPPGLPLPHPCRGGRGVGQHPVPLALRPRSLPPLPHRAHGARLQVPGARRLGRAAVTSRHRSGSGSCWWMEGTTVALPRRQHPTNLTTTITPHHPQGFDLPCRFISARDEAAAAALKVDATIWHAPTYCWVGNRPPGSAHLRIVGSTESAVYYNCLDHPGFMAQFDMEMTYRMCSQVRRRGRSVGRAWWRASSLGGSSLGPGPEASLPRRMRRLLFYLDPQPPSTPPTPSTLNPSTPSINPSGPAPLLCRPLRLAVQQRPAAGAR